MGCLDRMTNAEKNNVCVNDEYVCGWVCAFVIVSVHVKSVCWTMDNIRIRFDEMGGFIWRYMDECGCQKGANDIQKNSLLEKCPTWLLNSEMLADNSIFLLNLRVHYRLQRNTDTDIPPDWVYKQPIYTEIFIFTGLFLKATDILRGFFDTTHSSSIWLITNETRYYIDCVCVYVWEEEEEEKGATCLHSQLSQQQIIKSYTSTNNNNIDTDTDRHTIERRSVIEMTKKPNTYRSISNNNMKTSAQLAATEFLRHPL